MLSDTKRSDFSSKYHYVFMSFLKNESDERAPSQDTL